MFEASTMRGKFGLVSSEVRGEFLVGFFYHFRHVYLLVTCSPSSNNIEEVLDFNYIIDYSGGGSLLGLPYIA